jgi:hypothetical protein
VPLINQVFAPVLIIVAIPYVTSTREEDVVLAAKNIDTPVFGVIVTFALELVLEIREMVVPTVQFTWPLFGINKDAALELVK